MLPLALPLAVPAAVADTGGPVVLEIGDRHDWTGVLEENSPTSSTLEAIAAGSAPLPSSACAAFRDARDGAPTCQQWTFSLPDVDGARLRVAVDHPLPTDYEDAQVNVVDLAVTGPDGRDHHATRVTEGATGTPVPVQFVPWSPEVLVDAPAPGTWTVTLFARAVAKRAPYRARVLLEPLPERSSALVLPNLRVVPPYGLGLWTSETPGRYPARGCYDPLPGDAGEEDYGKSDVACLRFAFGHANHGEGPLDLVFGVNGGTVRQRVWTQDRSDHEETKDAGSVEYHNERSHRHYHYRELFLAQLYELDPEAGQMRATEEGRKLGACGHDWKSVRWDDPVDSRPGAEDSGADCAHPLGAAQSPGAGAGLGSTVPRRIGMSAGYADVYFRSQVDNYVPFRRKSNGKWPLGEFVLLVTADPGDKILESDDSDNVSYVHFEVKRGRDTREDHTSKHPHDDETRVLRVLERGYGGGPLDPDRVPVQEWDPLHGWHGP